MLGYSLKFLFPPLNTTVERIMANQNQTSVSSAQFTELSADNAVYLESLYEQYLQDPQSVDEKIYSLLLRSLPKMMIKTPFTIPSKTNFAISSQYHCPQSYRSISCRRRQSF